MSEQPSWFHTGMLAGGRFRLAADDLLLQVE